MPKELWKDIIGYVGFYKVSDFGRVRSLDRIVSHKPSKRFPKGYKRHLKGCILKQNTRDGGYLSVQLAKGGVNKRVLIHRLVLETFVELCPEGMECCHDDGDPTNNSISNLRWDSRAHNHLDKRKHGTALQGAKSPNAKLTDKDVLEIIGKLKAGETQKSISKIYRVHPGTIGKIARVERWKHIKR